MLACITLNLLSVYLRYLTFKATHISVLGFAFKQILVNILTIPTAHYFLPMVFSGCLSIVSGVIVAYCNHKSSDDIPPWLCKLIKGFTKLKKCFSKVKNDVPNKQVCNIDSQGLNFCKFGMTFKFAGM